MTALHPTSTPVGIAQRMGLPHSSAAMTVGRVENDDRNHAIMDLSVWGCSAPVDVTDNVMTTLSVKEDHGAELREFLTANYKRLHQRLARHLGCSDLASDCLHDAWLRLGDTAISEPVQSPEAYVYRVACNLAMDRLRSNRPWLYASEVESELEALIDHAPGPDVIVEARADLEAVERAIERLPRRHRSVLVALRIEEKTRQEVADWLHISVRSVDTALRQALEHCAAPLQKWR